MTAVAFDTLKLARKLRDSANMTQEQAEGVADALAEAMSGAELATKRDLAETRVALEAKLADIRVDLLKWVIGAIGFQTVVIIGALVTLLKSTGH